MSVSVRALVMRNKVSKKPTALLASCARSDCFAWCAQATAATVSSNYRSVIS